MRKLPYILFLLLLALSQGCVSDNPEFDRIIQSLPSFMLQVGTETFPQGGSTARNDLCFATAIDPQDEGIYCAGFTFGDFAEPNGDPTYATTDAYLLKFDRNKKLLWARQFGGVTFAADNTLHDAFTDIAFDSRGFVYVSGKNNGSAMVAKFGRKGDLIWRKLISGSSNCSEIAIRRDRIFCAGNDSGLAQAYEIDQDGNMLWLRQTMGGTENISDLELDAQGNLIMLGSTESTLSGGHVPAAGETDIFIWKVTNSGTEVWLQQFGTNPYTEYAGTVAIDKSGFILIGGFFKGNGVGPPAPDDDFDPGSLNNTGTNSFLASFRDTGTGLIQNWFLPIYHTTDNYVESVVVTSRNEIIAGGTTIGSLFEIQIAGTVDAFFMKVSASGSLLSARQFASVSRGKINNDANENCTSLALDPLGNILCGGHSNGNTNETNGGAGFDIMIWRVGPDLEF